MNKKNVINVEGLSDSISKTKEYIDATNGELAQIVMDNFQVILEDNAMIKTKVNNIEITHVTIKSKSYEGTTTDYSNIFTIESAVNAIAEELNITGDYSINTKNLYIRNTSDTSKMSFKFINSNNGDILLENSLNVNSNISFSFHNTTNWTMAVAGEYSVTVEIGFVWKTKAGVFADNP